MHGMRLSLSHYFIAALWKPNCEWYIFKCFIRSFKNIHIFRKKSGYFVFWMFVSWNRLLYVKCTGGDSPGPSSSSGNASQLPATDILEQALGERLDKFWGKTCPSDCLETTKFLYFTLYLVSLLIFDVCRSYTVFTRWCVV